MNQLSSELEERLIQEAFIALKRAYAPYSKFQVGVAILLKDDVIIHGCNIENASYGLTSCAERNALFNVYAQGYHKQDIIAMALVTNAEKLTTPCGACRQVISELMDSNAIIILKNLHTKQYTTLEKLLPLRFTEEGLL